MRIPRIYVDMALSEQLALTLPESQSHYVTTVLRLKNGSPLTLFNGSGGEYKGRLQSTGKKQTVVELFEFDAVERESPLRTQLAIGISRGERMDWVIQKATELGVSSIVPLFTERTEVKLKGERQEKKLRHWHQICISACEQSHRTRLPSMEQPQPFSDLLKSCKSEYKLLLHGDLDSTTPLREIPSKDTRLTDVTVLIGPEGGLSDIEVQQAVNAGFIGCRLGPRTLRTETAPIAALTLLQFWWGDF